MRARNTRVRAPWLNAEATFSRRTPPRYVVLSEDLECQPKASFEVLLSHANRHGRGNKQTKSLRHFFAQEAARAPNQSGLDRFATGPDIIRR